MRFTPRVGLVATAVLSLLALAACSGGSSGDQGDLTPARPTHWIVSLGDSYISGEGARWAGNTDGAPDPVDAQGPFAYGGPNGLEAIPGCHRARQSEVDVQPASVGGVALTGKDLACSGAETATKTESDGSFKPGIDFYDHGSKIGQALALQRFAAHHHVSDVVLSIGGNNFEFSTLVTDCVEDFLGTVSGKHGYCSADPSLTSLFSSAHVAKVQSQVEGAIANIVKALSRAGEKPAQYRIIVQDYPSPVPPGDLFRYPQTLHARFDVGGCPLFDKDADWANTTVLPTIDSTVKNAVAASGLSDITFLNLADAFVGHRLCEKGANQIQDTGLASWRSPGAANQLEWVNQIYVKGIPWQTQESAHPNFWGALAERNCLRQVVEAPAAATESCVRTGTAVHDDEPVMHLQR